jgi:hypothetical protein
MFQTSWSLRLRSRALCAVFSVFALVTLTLTGQSATAAERAILKVSAIPDEAPTELLRKFKPL